MKALTVSYDNSNNTRGEKRHMRGEIMKMTSFLVYIIGFFHFHSLKSLVFEHIASYAVAEYEYFCLSECA